MTYIKMEELMKRIGSRYKLVILASRRTMELSEGKTRLVELPQNVRLATVAIKEIEEGKISYKLTEGKAKE